MKLTTRPGLPRLQERLGRLCAEVGTPFFAYDWESLQRAIRRLAGTLAGPGMPGRPQISLPLFTLPNLSLLARLVEGRSELGVNCNSAEEVESLQVFGWQCWDRVVFSGGVLPSGDLQAIAVTGCLLNVASRGNLRLLLAAPRPARIGLRVDFGGQALKGLRLGELDACLAEARDCGQPVEALHAYPGTEVQDLDLLIRHAEVLVALAAQYPEVQEINFGGGFWYDYASADGCLERMVDFTRYAAAVGRALEHGLSGRALRLGWEPGRIVFAGAGFFVTEVLEVRENSPNTADVYVDASFTQLPVLKLRSRQHQVAVVRPDGSRKAGVRYEARVCGCTTLSTDTLLPRPCPLPAVEPGDLLVVFDVGAYGRAGSYNFLNKALPPEVLLDDRNFEVLRHRQRRAHLLEGLSHGS